MRVNKIDFKFFSSHNFKMARKEFEDTADSILSACNRTSDIILAYYNDEESLYKTIFIMKSGECHPRDLKDWNELSEYLHEHIQDK